VDIGAFEVGNQLPQVTCLLGVETLGCAPAAGRSVNVPASVTDLDKDQTLTVRLTENSTPLGTQVVSGPANNTLITFADVTLTPGLHTLSIEVNDGAATSFSRITLTIDPDNTPPVLTCPGNQVANATTPKGAMVSYPAAKAADNCGSGAVTILYLQNSGTLFGLGDTTVTVTAVDPSGNPATPCTFNVHVKGAVEQINDLIAKINALPGVKGLDKTAFLAKLQAALAGLMTNPKISACGSMQDFINLVQAQTSKKLISADTGASLITDAKRIRTVIGCL
jgi:hypothetical protein